jgi:hypothetical protein
VKLKAYGPLSTRYISDFVNTATWGTTIPQGFSVRSGGGELYPVLSQEAYADEHGWAAGANYFDNTTRASISRCLGEFAIGTGGAFWKEVYTDRCLDLNKWLHIVATWDGEDMRYFVDGHDATDGWRVNGVDAKTVMDSVVRLHIGASTISSSDSRHAFAEMDFVTIHDSALKPSEIRSRYRATLALAKQDSIVPTCRRTIKILSPEAGQAITAETRIHVRLEASPECEDSSIDVRLGVKDSVELQVSGTPDFTKYYHGKFRDTSATFGKVVPQHPSGEVFIRCRLKNDSDSVAHASAGRIAARAAAVQPVSIPWEASRPLVIAQSTGITSAKAGRLAVLWTGSELRVQSADKPMVRDLSGRLQGWTAAKSGKTWILRPSMSSHGVYLIANENSAARIVLP